MRLAAVALVALVGCGGGGSFGDDTPIYTGGGGGGGGTSGGGDGGTTDDSTDSGPTVGGKVCVVADARMLTTSCKTDEVDGLLVTLANHTARTIADGSFEIEQVDDPAALWHVTSDAQSMPQILPSIQQVSLSNVIPAFSTIAYQNLLTANAADPADGSGGVFLRVTQNGMPLSNVEAETTSQYIRYDNDLNAVQWQQSGGTESHGVVWLAGVAPDADGNATVQLTPATGEPMTATVKVVAGALTFATVAFP